MDPANRVDPGGAVRFVRAVRLSGAAEHHQAGRRGPAGSTWREARPGRVFAEVTALDRPGRQFALLLAADYDFDYPLAQPRRRREMDRERSGNEDSPQSRR